ncbi:MAG: cytochrome C biogenesis protein [Nanoarchaeota archaeon]|nr:cytochrome C biogenesis protein [Nanoarchaeota archaeon]
MISVLVNFWISFLAGLFAPLAAVCVLPLYPAFLAYLSNQVSGKDSKKTIILLGVIVATGVITSMFLIGLIFTKFLQASLTNVIGIISPIAFGILAIVSLFLIFNFDFSRLLPQIKSPALKNPFLSSFVFGFFFGAIVLPCNPASLIILFAISTSTIDFTTNLFNFIFFGVGMSLPLLLFAFISAQWSEKVIGFLTKNKRKINLFAGLIMLGISVYYLFFVFRIFG